MAHRFSIKEIAAQAGVGTATVDRVVNNRAHVSARTAARVAAAIEELKAQEAQLAAKGRQVWIDVLVEAPERFLREIRQATEAAAAQVAGAVVRVRFHMYQVMEESQTVAALTRFAKRGSHGVCLKARDVPRVRAAVAALQAKGVPVVALVTDVAGTDAYAGLNNAQAGQVAAALIAREMSRGVVLVSASREDFAGEAERIAAFRAHLSLLRPDVRLAVLPAAAGLNQPTGAGATALLASGDDVRAVYSVGGGNRALTAALQARGLQPAVFVAHDLDVDNKDLLARGMISHVLHHDLERDMAAAFEHVLARQRLAMPRTSTASVAQIVIRENMPD